MEEKRIHSATKRGKRKTNRNKKRKKTKQKTEGRIRVECSTKLIELLNKCHVVAC